MKVFTIWQPWASLIILGAKPFEFRRESFLNRRSYTNGPEIGERIAVHAAARLMKLPEVVDLLRRLDDEINSTGLNAAIARKVLLQVKNSGRIPGALPRSAILGTVLLGEPKPSADVMPGWKDSQAINDSDRIEHAKYAWPMTEIRAFDEPIPARGMQGFWNATIPEGR